MRRIAVMLVAAGMLVWLAAPALSSRPFTPLEIARQGSDGRMHAVARLPVKVRRGRFSARVALRRPAVHRLRIVFPGDARNRAARSADVYLRAVRPR